MLGGIVKVLSVMVAGYLVALPAFWWCRNDLRGFHRPLWVGYGSRDTWIRAVSIGYAVGGWPALVVAFAWRSSQARTELTLARQRHDVRRGDGNGVGVAAP